MGNTVPPYIIEICKSLEDEIEELRRKGASEIKVHNGKLTKIEGSEYIYSFVFEDEIITTDDQPIEISIDNKRYHAVIIGKVGNTILVATKDNLGEVIGLAVLIISPIFLLKALISTIQQLPKLEGYNFNLSNEIIGEKKLPKVVKSKDLPANIDFKKLNNEKIEAIFQALSNRLTFIWGPPGTGKTTTIAKIAECLLKANKKLLITSHTNIAVDTALFDILENDGNNRFYENGEILRYGIHQLVKLDKYPLIFGSNIITQKSKKLLNRLAQIDIEEKKINNQLREIEGKISSLRYLNGLINKIQKIISKKESLKETINSLQIKFVDKKETKQIIKQQLIKAQNSNWLSNFMQGLNVDKLMKEVRSIENDIDSIDLQLKINNENLENINKEIKEMENEVKESGLSVEEIQSNDQKNIYQEKLNLIDNLRQERRDIQELLDQMSKAVLKTAKIVATTLTKCYLREEILLTNFDTVIIDEISMAQIPQLLVAIGMGKQIILVGDFLQLPPIVQSKTELAKKWLGQSLYDYFEIPINFLTKGYLIPHIKPLRKQFRMHRDICELINKKVYKGYLNSDKETSKKRSERVNLPPFNGHIGFFETNEIEAYCRRKEGGSRYNIKNAFIDIIFAYKTVKEYLKHRQVIENKEVVLDERLDIFGIVSPYRAQANLITKIVSDIELEINNKLFPLAQFVEVNTVHRFQGNQRDVILFDTTDDFPMYGPAPMIDDGEENGEDVKLINVAVTRSKDKFLMLGNSSFINKTHSNSSLIKQLIPDLINKGKNINQNVLIDNSKDLKNIRMFNSWDQTLRKIETVENTIKIVISDLLNNKGFNKLKTILFELAKKRINIEIFTQHPTLYSSKDQESINVLLKLLELNKIKVVLITKIKEILFFIDNEEVLFCIQETKPLFVTVKTVRGIKEIIRLFNLSEEGTISPCPECKKRGWNGVLLLRQSRFGSFYGCSLYPKCKYIDKKRKDDALRTKLDNIKSKCPECGSEIMKKRGKYGFFYGCSNYPKCKYILK